MEALYQILFWQLRKQNKNQVGVEIDNTLFVIKPQHSKDKTTYYGSFGAENEDLIALQFTMIDFRCT
jgi:hypothetical protein